MSTSLLYHAFGAAGFVYLKTDYKEGCIVFHLRKAQHKQRCSYCQSRDVIRRGFRIRKLRTIPIGHKPVFLNVRVARLQCETCGCCRQEAIDLARPRKSYTRKLEGYIMKLSTVMTILDIAHHVALDWHQVAEVISNHLKCREKQRSWRKVSRIAIDEIAVRKGHNYLSVVVNLDSGEVLDVVEGRNSEALAPVFRRLKKARARLKAIAIDLSPAYIKAVRDYAPKQVRIVHDRFHLIQLVNKALDAVRRQEQSRAEKKQGQQVLKGARYLLLRAREKLLQTQNKASRLEALLAINENLNRAYLLKEDLRQLWEQPDKKSARTFLRVWLKEALSVSMAPIRQLAKTIKNNATGILSWFDHRISTGPLEGLNNKIKVLKRRAYGYRNYKFFRLLLLFIHQTTFKLARS